MKSKLKKLIPTSWLGAYHKSLAIIANAFYGRPSEKMRVVGVTGTNGKSTTVMLIAKILEQAGFRVGATSTAMFKVAEKEWLNDKKMTMLGRFALQKMLSEMVGAKCDFAVIEISSEGIKQFRHLGVHCDTLVFTNLTPEHLEAHGGFENYKKAKLELFSKLGKGKNKTLNVIPAKAGIQSSEKWITDQVGDDKTAVKKTIIVNGDDKYAEEFLNFKVDQKIIFSVAKEIQDSKSKILKAEDIQFKSSGVSFKIEDTQFDLKLLGRFNVYNALAAISVASSQEIDLNICKSALEKVESLPGRMEFIPASAPAELRRGENNSDFKILVDYAPEPESLGQLYQTIKDHQLVSEDKKIIHVLGSCGGGRDRARRPILGEIAGQNSAIAIITNEDPYDDDPMKIIDDVAEGAVSSGKTLDQNLFKILDRREAIKKAISLAEVGDLVLLTGKGSEQAICVKNGKKIPWDEREVVREILADIKK